MMSSRASRASARRRKQQEGASSPTAGDATPPRSSSPRKTQRDLDTPDWLSDLDIHLSPKASASTRKVLASVKKSSPTKRASSRSYYSFTSSSQSSGEDYDDKSPQKIGARSFYSAKSKGRYLTPLERKTLREKLNKSADDADLNSNKRGSPRKKVATKKATAKKPKNQTKSTAKKTTKAKAVVKKTKTQNKTPKSPAVSPRKVVKKSPSQKLPKKSPRRSIPKRSPWKATSAKKGIQLYMQQQGGKQQKPKSASKPTKKNDKVKEESGKAKKSPSPRKSPRKNQEDEEDNDKAAAIRGLDFGDAMDEVDQEVTDIAQRIQSLIDTSFDEDEEVIEVTPKASTRKRMRTKEQSFEDVELPKSKKPRLASATPGKSPKKSSSSSTPKRTPQKQNTSSKSRISTPNKTASPRRARTQTPVKASTPSKVASPNKRAVSPSKRSSTPSKKVSSPIKAAFSPTKKTSTPSKKTSTPRKSSASPAAARSPAKRGSPMKSKSPYRGVQPDTPESSSITSQESPRNALSKLKDKQNRIMPMFTPPTSPSVRSTPPSSSSRKKSPFMLKKLNDKDGRDQLTLDVGQKKFGTTICKTCSMVFTHAHPEDEANHSKFHKKYLTYIKFPGWKTETVLQEFHDGRILLVTSDSPKYALKKIEEVRELVDQELGFLKGNSIADKQSLKTLLFVTLDKKVGGCLIAEEITAGYRVIPDNDPQLALSQSSSEEEVANKEQQRAWCCQTTPERAVCGISRIWVSASMRRKNIGRRMVDCIRNHFIYGSILTADDIAFSDPTPDGKGFATRYTGTPSFLVYKYKT